MVLHADQRRAAAKQLHGEVGEVAQWVLKKNKKQLRNRHNTRDGAGSASGNCDSGGFSYFLWENGRA